MVCNYNLRTYLFSQETFNAGPTFAGFALLINTAGICITAPVLGHLMDKLNPYVFMAASAFLLPVSYWFIGPAPFLAVSFFIPT